MTYKEGCDKVLMLLDEYSSGGAITVDEDIKKKMAHFFDVAQKQMANLKRIVKTYNVPLESGVTEYPMPEGFNKLYRIWADERLTPKRYQWRGCSVVIPAEGRPATMEIEYFAMPATLPPEPAEDYEFELAEDAAQVMPFFVAQQQLVTDLVVDYQSLKDLYVQQLQTVDVTLPGALGRGVRQSFFRGV